MTPARPTGGLISGISGFQAYTIVRGEGTEAVSVSVFDDRAGAEESNRVAADWVRADLPDLSISPPHVVAGEVAVSF